MNISPDMTLREAIGIFYKANNLPEDGGVSKKNWSPITCRGLKIYLPNFEWRKKAIPFHDLHHMLTGYNLSPTGEFQISAWEFAAGRYPNIFTTFFCIPLVGMGAVLIPKKQFIAFLRGRRSQTLYSYNNYEPLLNKTVGELQKEILTRNNYSASRGDVFAYLTWVALSFLVISIPFFVFLLILPGVF